MFTILEGTKILFCKYDILIFYTFRFLFKTLCLKYIMCLNVDVLDNLMIYDYLKRIWARHDNSIDYKVPMG